MARSLTNFLLLETIYDDIPPVNAVVKAFADKILSPTLAIVEDDCLTKLGRVIDLSETAVGKVSLFSYGTFSYDSAAGSITETINSGDILTESKVTALLTNQTEVATRSISTCTSVGGLCRKCIRGSDSVTYPNLGDVPPVGETWVSDPLSKRSYLTYVSNTHSGGLMGFKALEAEGDAILPVREELVRSKIVPAELAKVFREVSRISSMDNKLIEYAKDVDDILEKSLLLILLYGVFINVRS